MAYRTPVRKVETCVRLLVGLGNASVVAALRPYGFTEAALEEGWARLRPILTAVEPELGEPPQAPVRELCAFEARWFPIARHCIGAAYPEVAEALLRGLRQERSNWAVLPVATFLERLRALEAGAAPYGDNGPAALRLLAARGLTAEERARARERIAALTAESTRADEVAVYEEERRRALDHAWAWYLDWSAVARVAIKNKTLLFALGLRARKAAKCAAVNCTAARAPAPLPAALPS